jgi:hypothetical protein
VLRNHVALLGGQTVPESVRAAWDTTVVSDKGYEGDEGYAVCEGLLEKKKKKKNSKVRAPANSFLLL